MTQFSHLILIRYVTFYHVLTSSNTLVLTRIAIFGHSSDTFDSDALCHVLPGSDEVLTGGSVTF